MSIRANKPNLSTIPFTLNPSLPTKLLAFLFNLLIFSLPFIFTWVNDELFEFNKMLFVYVMTTLIAVTWILRMISEKRLIFRRTFFDLPLLLFFFSQVISTIFSIHWRTSIFGYPSRLHGGLLSTISYLTLYYALVSNLTKKHLYSLFFILLSSCLLVSLYALPEHFGHSFSCLLMTHKFNASCWKQDVVSRIFGTFGQPNWLAAYLVTILPLNISVFLNQKRKSLKTLNFSIALLAFITLIFTKSRSGFLAFSASIGAYLAGLSYLFWQTKNKLIKLKSSFTNFWILVFGFLIFALALGTPYSKPLFDCFRSPSSVLIPKQVKTDQLHSDQSISDSGDIRKIVWQGAIKVWRHYSLFGSGVETFAYSYYQDRPVEHNQLSEWDFLYNKAHNEFLNFLATTGIVGLTTYLLIIFIFLSKSLKTIVTKQPNHSIIQSFSHKLIILGLLSGYLALSITNFFGFSTVTVGVLFFLYPGFFVILTKKLRNSEAKVAKSKPLSSLVSKFLSRSVAQLTLNIFILLFTLYILISVCQIWLADYRFATAKNLNSAGYSESALEYLHSAISLSPNQALYYDELTNESGELALALTKTDKPDEELISNLVAQAQLASDISLRLNPVHLPLYKSRISLYLSLSVFNPQFLELAAQTSQVAQQLAPTDPRTWYLAARTQELLGNQGQASELYKRVLQLKLDYGLARLKYAQFLESSDQLAPALTQYQFILQQINPDDPQVQNQVKILEASLSAETK